MTFRLPRIPSPSLRFFDLRQAGLRRCPQLTAAVVLLALMSAQALHGQAVVGQTVVPLNGTVLSLGSGFEHPIGIAVDGSGNVYISDFDHNAVKEILAVGGYTTVRIIGSGFDGPEGVAVDAAGDLFVADSIHNVVKEIEAVNGAIPNNPTIRIVGSGFSLPFGVAVDGAGNLFVADRGSNALKEIVAVNGAIPANNATIRTLASGFGLLSGVAIDGDGNLFVADTLANVIQVFFAVGGYSTMKTVTSGLSAPIGVAVNRNGDLFIAESGTYAIRELLATGGYTVADLVGNGFDKPEGVAVDAAGNLFIADTNNSAVKETLSPGGNFGAIDVGAGSKSPLMRSFLFHAPTTLGAVAIITNGSMGGDFTDAGKGSCTGHSGYSAGATCTVNVNFSPIQSGSRFGAVELLSPTGNLLASSPVQGVGVGPQLTFAVNAPHGASTMPNSIPSPMPQIIASGGTLPSSIVTDAAGNVFFTDALGNSVKEILAAGGYSTLIPLGGNFEHPRGLARDGAGNLFVAGSHDNNQNPIKELIHVGGVGGYATASTLLHSKLFSLTGLALDGNLNIFVADQNSGTVKELLAADGYETILTLGGDFDQPSGIALDSQSNVFVADSGHNAVQEIVAAGGYKTVNTLGGGFSLPTSVAVDASGNVFVADSGNMEVKKIVAAGGYTTVNTVFSEAFHPLAVALDASGNLFVGDDNHQIIKLNFAAIPALSFASTRVGTTSADSPQVVTLTNEGNAPLMFSVPATGNNPSLPASFTMDGMDGTDGMSCPQLNSNSTTGAALAAGASCTLAIRFVPMDAGTLNGQLVIAENAKNAVRGQLRIELGGTSLAETSVELTSTTNPVLVMNSIALTATVSATSGTVSLHPTGKVTFFDGSRTIGSGSLIAGRFTLAVSTLPVGAHSITASYGGDTSFVASVSTPLDEAVQDFSVAAVSGGTPATATQIIGTNTYTVTLSPEAPATTFPAAINLSASGGPAGAIYTFSSSTVPLSAGVTSVALTIRVGGSSAVGNQSSAIRPGRGLPFPTGLPFASGLPFAALLLLPFTARLKKTALRLIRKSVRSVIFMATRSSAASTAPVPFVLRILLFVALCMGTTLCGCTSSIHSNPTPTHYTIVITATSGTLTHSTTVDLAVQ